jgi:hypothetical protein
MKTSTSMPFGPRPVRCATGPAGTGPTGPGDTDPGDTDPGDTVPLGPSDSNPAPVGASASAPAKGAAPLGTDRSSTRRTRRDSEVRLLAVTGRLTERDRLICRLLDEHRVLTTAQIADVGFTGERRARMRLAELYALDLIDRFRPRTWGNPAPFHWTLGPLGVALVAAEVGLEPSALSWRRTLAHELAHSQRLAHLVGTNGFFCALMRSARTRPGCWLDEWWSERRCAREWGEVVRPDGYGIWTEADTSLPILLEYDNGTETLSRLAGKLDGYRRLAHAAGHPNWVLFSFPTPRREHDAARALAGHGVPIATAARAPGVAPDSAIWAPLTPASGGGRLGLAQLADLPLDAA